MSARSERREEKKRLRKEKREERKNRYTKREKRQFALVGLMAIVALVLLVSTSKVFWSDDSPAAEVSTTQNTSATAPTVTTPAVPDYTEPSESQTTTETPTVNGGETEKEPVTEGKKEESQKDEKEEILKKVSDGVNSLKASDASFKGKKTQKLYIQLTECSVPAVTGLINGVLDRFLNDDVVEYDFTNGVATDPEEGGEITSNEAIPPSFIAFGLTSAGVKDAYVTKDGENTVYTVELIPEGSTLGEKPPHHGVACDVVSVEELDIPAKITKADYRYSGTKISVTYDPSGKVISYHEYLDMYGEGEGGAMGITATCTMEGYIDETWDIEWK